jgi:hypothetical protein
MGKLISPQARTATGTSTHRNTMCIRMCLMRTISISIRIEGRVDRDGPYHLNDHTTIGLGVGTRRCQWSRIFSFSPANFEGQKTCLPLPP